MERGQVNLVKKIIYTYSKKYKQILSKKNIKGIMDWALLNKEEDLIIYLIEKKDIGFDSIFFNNEMLLELVCKEGLKRAAEKILEKVQMNPVMNPAMLGNILKCVNGSNSYEIREALMSKINGLDNEEER